MVMQVSGPEAGEVSVDMAKVDRRRENVHAVLGSLAVRLRRLAPSTTYEALVVRSLKVPGLISGLHDRAALALSRVGWHLAKCCTSMQLPMELTSSVSF